MKKPNKAVIDGDIIVYKAAFWAEIEGIDTLEEKVNYDMKKWTPEGVDDIEVALSCSRKQNFRRKVWPNYKRNREEMHTPDCLPDVYDYITDTFNVIRDNTIEADDLLGVYASSGKAIAVTIDKDLKGVQGWHYNPAKDKEPVLITKKEADAFFCKQWMSGDSTDGIPGLWRIGPKKAEKFLKEWKKKDWHKNILEMYADDKYIPRDLHGVDPEEIGKVMGQCVKILDSRHYSLKTNKITMWCPKVG